MMSDSHASPAPAPPRLSTRDLRSFTAENEKRILVAIARRLPGWIGPDHLTALGALSMAGAGLCYRLVPLSSLALLGVNVFLFLNWFGDSLDGTVARVREKQRPRYGFFVDHLVDAFGAIFLLGGLASSGLVSPFSALALLIAYLLLQIHIALKSQTTHVFQIAFAGIGGTEVRLVLGLLNLAVLLWPGLTGLGSWAAWCAAFALAVLVLKSGYETGVLLDREERLLWADRSASTRPIGPC
jgi:archaetidylinositol phosphate synthase